MTARDPDVNPIKNLLNARTNAETIANKEALYLMSMVIVLKLTLFIVLLYQEERYVSLMYAV